MKVTGSSRKPPAITLARISDYKEAIARMKRITTWDQEAFVIVTMSPDFRIIGEHVINVGGFWNAQVSLQVLFERVITDKAQLFVIGHNHVNGNGIPSMEDFDVLIKIMITSEFLEIRCLDSIIFPHGKEPMSMKMKYPKVFKTWYADQFSEFIKKFIPRKVIQDAS